MQKYSWDHSSTTVQIKFETCTRSPCESWHPPECQFCLNESGCKAEEKCLFPHYKVDEQPNKKPKKSIFLKRRESDDKNAVAVKIVPQLGCISQDSDALVSQRGKQSRRNPMQKILGPIRRMRFTQSTLRQASFREKKRALAWKNTSKILISEVPTL